VAHNAARGAGHFSPLSAVSLIADVDCLGAVQWSRMRFVVEVIIFGGGLPDFQGASCSGSAFSAPVVSVSMSLVLRGSKKLRVDTALGGSLTAVDIVTDLVDFLAVCEVSLEICLLRLFTFWKS
jgi:hypothetical protein